jgi:hypothetical protein
MTSIYINLLYLLIIYLYVTTNAISMLIYIYLVMIVKHIAMLLI